MPIYEYACSRCGHLFEKFQSIHDAPVMSCEQCSRPAKRIISRSSFILRGTGWYATDYKKGNPQLASKTHDALANHKKQ